MSIIEKLRFELCTLERQVPVIHLLYIQDICSRFEDCMPSPIYATLEALTIIGVVLSLIGITATIVTLLLFK